MKGLFGILLSLICLSSIGQNIRLDYNLVPLDDEIPFDWTKVSWYQFNDMNKVVFHGGTDVYVILDQGGSSFFDIYYNSPEFLSMDSVEGTEYYNHHQLSVRQYTDSIFSPDINFTSLVQLEGERTIGNLSAKKYEIQFVNSEKKIYWCTDEIENILGGHFPLDLLLLEGNIEHNGHLYDISFMGGEEIYEESQFFDIDMSLIETTDHVFNNEYGDDILIYGILRDFDTGSLLTNISVEVEYSGPGRFEEVRTNELGQYAFIFPIGTTFDISFGGEKYVVKTISIDATNINKTVAKGGFEMNIDITLFTPIEGEDWSFMESTPIGKAKYNVLRDQIAFDFGHTDQMNKQIEEIFNSRDEKE